MVWFLSDSQAHNTLDEHAGVLEQEDTEPTPAFKLIT